MAVFRFMRRRNNFQNQDSIVGTWKSKNQWFNNHLSLDFSAYSVNNLNTGFYTLGGVQYVIYIMQFNSFSHSGWQCKTPIYLVLVVGSRCARGKTRPDLFGFI